MSLIKELISKISEINTLDLLSFFAMDLFAPPEEFSKVMHEANQACTEFVAGLLSSKMPVKNGKLPSPEDLKEIKQLWQRIIAGHIFQFLPNKKNVKTYDSREIETIGQAFFISSYFMTVRGEGYPNQLWNAAIEIYSPHNSFLVRKLGFTIQQAIDIFKWLSKEIERRVNEHTQNFVSIMRGPMEIWRKWKEGEINDKEMFSMVEKINKEVLREQIKLHNVQTKNIFIFNKKEIGEKFGKKTISSFLNRFAARFGEINKNYTKPSQLNDLYKKPILIIAEDEIFIPVPQLLYQVPVVTLHYDLIQDPDYEAQYTEFRGRYLEKKASILLGSIFGPFSFFPNLHFTDHKGKPGEIDILIKFDNKIIIIECKSKSLTLPAKQGNLDQIRNDFADAIQLAYDQNKRAIDYIYACEKADFYQKNGTKISVQKDKINGCYSILITANTYATLATDLSNLLKKDPVDPYPWAVCIGDLELISDYLFDPYLFIHFLKRRLILHGHVMSPDEMDYVGCYLQQGLYFEEELKKADRITLFGFTEQFDADQLKKMGKLKSAQIGTSWSNPVFENLIGSIKQIGGYGHSDIVLALLDIDSQTRDNLIKFMKKVIGQTIKNGKVHDFTMPGKDFGFSFICDKTRKNLGNRVLFDGKLKKYKYRAKIWLAMGRDVTDPSYLVNEFVYLMDEWKYDPTLEDLVKRHLKKGKKIKLP